MSTQKRFSPADIIKFAGLMAFFAIMALVCFLIWPLVAELFEPGGIDRVIAQVRDAGPGGVLILLAIEFLQVVVAFIPGEVVQLAAGMMYGPWIGALIVFVGCVISSAFVFVIVHWLGAPFVQDMLPQEQLNSFKRFEETGKLDIIVFILFLIPGLPKDVFTYLVPLTDMKLVRFLLLSNVGRIPGILVSTYAAASLIEGDIVTSIIIFAIAAVVAGIGIWGYTRFMAKHDQRVEAKHDRDDRIEDAKNRIADQVQAADSLGSATADSVDPATDGDAHDGTRA